MATPRSQRIGIWIIALVLTIGTLGSFLVMVLGMQNQSTFKAKYLAEDAKYKTAVAAQAKELSDKYYATFSQFSSRAVAFDASTVTTLSTNDLLIGDGDVIASGSAYSAYYIGWTPNGIIFDQSISDGSLKTPIAGGGLISGWEEGVIGMKLGGVRELLIPSDKAYGATGNGDSIPANTPIKFVVMVIPKITEVPIPPILIEYYKAMNS